MALLCLAATGLHACGPSFPNNLLDLGDNAVLLAPVADFEREIERMKLAPARFRAVPLPRDDGFADQAADAEMEDLRAALRKAKVSAAETERISQAHRAERDKLKDFVTDIGRWNERQASQSGDSPRPKFPKIELTPDLPPEFENYFAGAIAWHNPVLEDKSIARESWSNLLARPASERKFKSTWAAFMLGKSWDGIEPAKAVKYFRQVRELAKSGFADPLGLAAASYGLEARAYYVGGNYGHAIELYLEQLGTGDDSAMASLREVAAAALAASEALPALATNALARQVITAQAICWRNLSWNSDGDTLAPTNALTGAWLTALEEAAVKNVESAEKLALAAYQAGAFDMARRWVARASNAPVAQWIQAKLLLRAGKVKEAATELAKVTEQLPVTGSTAAHGTAEFADELFAMFSQSDEEAVPARRQVLGELGVLHLSRGEFTQALNALLRAGFWMDAAYVAERVLTVKELKNYVDQNWPLAAPMHAREVREIESPTPDPSEATTEPPSAEAAAPETAEAAPDNGETPAAFGQKLRYLLARRLTRENLGHLARDYYPTCWQTNFDALAGALIAGCDESQAAAQRAESLFSAARIARQSGMELLGTEVQPDWHVHDGNYEGGVTWESRSANERHATINVPTSAEIQQASRHTADPERRFHYRYQAAFLAFEAAKLMPNHSDDTALVLWTGGSWLKNRDPLTADIFYKALVRRCRKTALGAAADLKRWFPELDDQGNVLPTVQPGDYEPRTVPDEPAEMAGPAEGSAPPDMSDPSDGMFDTDPESAPLEYIIHSGDTLAAIIRACQASGLSVSVRDLLAANPGLEPNRLRVGQKILIVAPKP